MYHDQDTLLDIFWMHLYPKLVQIVIFGPNNEFHCLAIIYCDYLQIFTAIAKILVEMWCIITLNWLITSPNIIGSKSILHWNN